MLKSLYIVHDTVAQTCIGGIIQEQHDNSAARAFYDALKSKDSILSQHPDDFRLLRIGEIDDDGNVIPTMGGPIIVATGTIFKLSLEPSNA